MSAGVFLELRWSVPAADAAIVGYQILQGATEAEAVQLDQVNALRWLAPVTWTGQQTFWVRAVDELGQVGEAASVTVSDTGVTTTSSQRPAATVSVDELGNAVISFTPLTEPQIQDYELRQGASFDAGTFVARTTGTTFTLPLLTTAGNTYWIRARFTDLTYSVLTYSVVFDSDALSTPTGLSWSINERELRFTWRAVTGAAQYLVLFEDGGVARIRVVSVPEVTFFVPKYSSNIRVVAVGTDGSLSRPLDEELAIVGQYRLNEILTTPVPISAGKFVNMAWTDSTTVRRAGLRGLTAASPFAANINDGDLYTFGYNLAAIPASQFEATPASWFRDKFWLERNGAFESGVIDTGAVRTGRVLISLTKTIDFVGNAAVSTYDYVNSEYLFTCTADQLIDTKAFVTVALLASSDNVTWREVANGDWVSARYYKVAGQVAMASPLTEVRVTAGTLTIDVEDIIETGSKAGVTNAGSAVTFTKPFSVVSVVIATARGNATAYATGVGPTGCTLWTNSATATQVDYYVKGY